tara:strand:- start:7012 stop:7782 length:771 start_codon:yes stop_codon:yes gene_type:complete
MLAKRIIPCLDVKNNRVVKGKNFENLVDAGNPVELAKKYNKQGADELIFLDITASIENRKTIIEMVKLVAKQIFIPFTVGGGISTIEDIRNLLSAGADKVSINSAAVKNIKLIEEAANTFGSQCIVIAIDAKKKIGPKEKESWEVYVNSGKIPTGIDALEWAKKVESLGAGEILLTSMNKDGTKSGYDNDLTNIISKAVNIPVIASGGAGTLKSIEETFKNGKADAALAASIFHYDTYTVKQVKTYLKNKQVEVRE